MQRRGFLALGGLAAGGAMLPPLLLGRAIAAEQLLETLDPARKKQLADAALQAATDAGASHCDVRIGRYLRQSLITREHRVENVANEESVGVGVRVVAGDAWGFAATSRLDPDAVAAAARQAVAIGARVLWLQLGIESPEAGRIATEAGLEFVQNRCVKIEHARFFGGMNLVGLATGVVSGRRSLV